MSETVTIKVYEIAGSSACATPDDGQKVYDQIVIALRDKRKVALSFANVQSLTVAFLNSAIGQLYGAFEAQNLKASLSATDIQPADVILLKRVVDNAKRYFSDPERSIATTHTLATNAHQ